MEAVGFLLWSYFGLFGQCSTLSGC